MTDTVGFSVGAVARRLGVAPSTLRTWNRRYGIGARELSPGRHRRYTAADITRLEHMQKLILRGAAPADAARAAMAAPAVLVPAPAGAADGGAADGAAAGRPAAGQATAVLVPGQTGAGPGADGHEAGAHPGEGPPAPRPGPGHGSGGQRLALPGASAAARGLARAALALDEQWVSETIRTALIRDGSVRTWEELLVPVLSGIGTRFEHTGTCVEAEHLLSVAVIAAFSRRAADLPVQVQHRAVLLASAESEQHSLPLHALAAALAEQGIGSRVLGPDLPYFALAAAVRRTGPGVVFLWSQARATGDPDALPGLSPRRPGARLILGGPGWDRERIPAAARFVDTLPEARSEVAAALGY
ncbi:MAG TPA: MerR family transcriptional regulator [Streptosporangiaceae bacterium]|nr:MerR family transcriptional regulator [Streptosporangiaceae bacterium]